MSPHFTGQNNGGTATIIDKTPLGTLKTFSKTPDYELNIINSCKNPLSPLPMLVYNNKYSHIRFFTVYYTIQHCNGGVVVEESRKRKIPEGLCQ